ncbi:hypothetical protein C8035_v000157 [Colletotrichum spinosum]|uniref:Uncharacterized protein n=1 Tax=Colletotrichum spinosum TaxID=1347390 RepID=A0A4V3HQ31_9PEZI|nr:hypothetical protein C8035_v000157 [Colletotrichum spinosum]
MSDNQKYTIGWICAVDIEFSAAVALLDEDHGRPKWIAPHDNNTYILGATEGHNVVIAVLPNREYGTTAAATVARDMVSSFPNIRVGLMVGIGGGAPSPTQDIRLGDVVVGTRGDGKSGVIQYDYGKALESAAFVRTGHLNQPPQTLLTAVAVLKGLHQVQRHRLRDVVDKVLEEKDLGDVFFCPPASSDRLYVSGFVHQDANGQCVDVCGDNPSNVIPRRARGRTRGNEKDEVVPKIHYGLIASGNSVIKHAVLRDGLVKDEGVLCFEMEAAGLMNHFPCLVIRGICDYSDSHKNKTGNLLPPSWPQGIQRNCYDRWYRPNSSRSDELLIS